jgi:hypothetical protein
MDNFISGLPEMQALSPPSLTRPWLFLNWCGQERQAVLGGQVRKV